MADPRGWTAPRVAGLTVFMRGLKLDAEIGLYPHERGVTQPLIVDVDAELSPRAVGAIADTLNYEQLADLARALAARGHVELVETYVQDLAGAVLRACPAAVRVRVRADKPNALPGTAGAGVEIILERGLG